MKFSYCENYEKVSQYVADKMIQTILSKKDANICLASGGSTQKAYEIFTQRVLDEKIDVSEVTFTKLDEWTHLSKDSELTCEYFVQKLIIEPLGIDEHHFITFNPEASDCAKECQYVSAALQKRPIDCCILGFGKNGHLGLNEPADSLHLYAHIAKLSEMTKGHAMLRKAKMEFGMTIGMKEIFDSNEILFILCGKDKEEPISQFMTQKIDTHLPGSLLWLHHHVDCIVAMDEYGHFVKD